MVKKFTEWKMLPFQMRGDNRSLYVHLIKELNEFYDYVNNYINLGSEVQFLDLPKLTEDIGNLKEEFKKLEKGLSTPAPVDLTDVNKKIKSLEDNLKSMDKKIVDIKFEEGTINKETGNEDVKNLQTQIDGVQNQLRVMKNTLTAYQQQIEDLKKKNVSIGNVDLTEVNNKIKDLEEGIKNIKTTSSGNVAISDNQLKDIKSHVLDEITKSLPFTEIMNKLNTQMEKNISSITKEEIEKLKVELEKDDEKY